MQVQWLFEKDAYHDGNTEAMIERCRSKAVPYQLVDFVLFGSDAHIRWEFGAGECVIVYGTIGMAKHVQRHKAWKPGVWCDWDRFKCSTYMAHWGRFSVQHDYAFLPIAEVYRQWPALWPRFSFAGHVFIKPDDNDKRFHGEKVSFEARDDWYKNATFYDAPPQSLAMISRPTRIHREWRLIVANRKVVTGSIYRADGRTGERPLDPAEPNDAAAIAFAETVTNSTDWQPAPIYTMDVCLLEGRQYRLVEIGCVNCCGLYQCDVAVVMDAAEGIAQLEWEQKQDVGQT